ncbi:endoplasmic reticulum membrane protein 65 [Trichomonascus vanleenenianus]|uniref:Emp65p n=1 Tax=Trichomonascus vanleenenianus TaxID=2268995 RepID=UPI003ECB6B65
MDRQAELAAEVPFPALRKSQSTSSLRKRATKERTRSTDPQSRLNAAGLSSPAVITSRDKLRHRLSISTVNPSASQSGGKRSLSLTLWQYLMVELSDSSVESSSEEKTEHLINVIKTPLYLERVVVFGVLMCLDTFLYTFTIFPLRVAGSIYQLFTRGGRCLSASRKADLLKAVIFSAAIFAVMKLDTSKIYHGIRGQAAIKLYVMFNVLELADKLCSAIGQDILECLYSTTTLQSAAKTSAFTLLAIIYCFIHSFVLLYQIITLNVAVNSYSNALLTLLLSNQFSEIKSSVFKKCERENLFQMTCADITERFQLLSMLLVIGVRNVVEVSNAGVIPNSWAGWNRWLGAMFGPAFVVVGSEVLVDWLKHAYITKFNNIRPQIYRKYLDVLALDYVESPFSDQTMTKRIGLPVLPLAAVFVRMIYQSYAIFVEQSNLFASSPTHLASAASPSARSALEKVDEFLRHSITTSNSYIIAPFTLSSLLVAATCFAILVVIKLILGVSLLKYASKRYRKVLRARRKFTGSKTKEAERSRDTRGGDFMMGPIKGYGVVELDDKTRRHLYDPEEEMTEWKEPKNKSSTYLDYWNVTRFKMVGKRIW